MSNTEIIKYNYLHKNPIENSIEKTGMTRMDCLDCINNSKWSNFRYFYSQRISMHEVMQKSELTLQECEIFIKSYHLPKIEQRNKKLLKPTKKQQKATPKKAVPKKAISNEEHFIKNVKLKTKNFQSKSKITKPYTYLDVVKLLKDSPRCYITKEKINLYDTKSWSLDHFIPASKGGSSDISNMKLCKTRYNYMKWVMTFDEFIEACKKVAEIHR